MNGLWGGAIGALEEQMHFRVARQGVLAANVANADTPRYRRRELEFEQEMIRATALARTHERHLTLNGSPRAEAYRLEAGPKGNRPDGNGIDLDQELVQLSRNAGAFMDQASVLNRLVTLRRVALSGAA